LLLLLTLAASFQTSLSPLRDAVTFSDDAVPSRRRCPFSTSCHLLRRTLSPSPTTLSPFDDAVTFSDDAVAFSDDAVAFSDDVSPSPRRCTFSTTLSLL
jgi:hypothetical protein